MNFNHVQTSPTSADYWTTVSNWSLRVTDEAADKTSKTNKSTEFKATSAEIKLPYERKDKTFYEMWNLSQCFANVIIFIKYFTVIRS